MSTLQDFVLDYVQQVGGLTEPSARGVHELILPDEMAEQWRASPYQRVAFDDVDDAEATRLGYQHPFVEALIASARAQTACARAYIADLRLDKAGLEQLALTAWSLPNSRVAIPRGATVTRVCSTYVLLNFKCALSSDEKREQLVSVVLDANRGHVASEPHRILQAVNAQEPDAMLGALPHAPLCWGGPDSASVTDPQAQSTLEALLQRAQTAVLHELADPLRRLQQGAQRFRDLDEARLHDYYDEIKRDLEQRLSSAQADRRASLEDKLSAVAMERAAKLADVAERYHVRVELTLLNLMLIMQPKLALRVSLSNRATTLETSAVWDPLLHRLEALVCDVCGEPSERTFLCHHGHLAHAQCLAPSCVDCKRVFCQRCEDAVGQCVVCEQPLCRYSRLDCSHCGRGVCQAHAGLCHVQEGQSEFRRRR